MRPCNARSAALPLEGKRIVITRPKEQAADLHARLTALGAEVLTLPAIAIRPPKSFKPLDDAIAHLADYDWIVFTSVNGVKYFFERCEKYKDAKFRVSTKAKVAAIGPATAMALEERGVSPDFVPHEYLSDEIARSMRRIAGKRILLPRADIARDTLPVALREKGARVDVVAAYRTVRPAATKANGARSRNSLARADVITFTSSSTVTHFMSSYGRVPAETLIACIGPKTAATAREHGLRVHILARDHTAPGLVQALVEFFHHSQTPSHVG